MAELRSQLRAATVRNETQELQKALERKEKERAQLSSQVEVCTQGSASLQKKKKNVDEAFRVGSAG